MLPTLQDPSPDRTTLMAEMRELLTYIPAKTKGLRLDIAFKADRGDELYIDVGSLHTTTAAGNPSRRTKTWLFYQKAPLRSDANHLGVSPVVAAAARTKDIRYTPLLQRVKAFYEESRRRRPAPVFNAAIVSHRGEFSRGTFSAIEWLATQAYITKANSDSTDGVTPSQASAALRSHLKDALATAVANGFGAVLLSAGFPASCIGNRVHPTEPARHSAT